MKKLLFIPVLLILSSLTVFAHEGHGHIASDNPLHYLAEPLHALVLIVALAAIGYAIYRFRRVKKQS